MNNYDLQFSIADVVEKLKEARNLSHEERNYFISIEGHTLTSHLSGLIVQGWVLSGDDSELAIKKPVERRYINNLYNLGEKLKEISHELFKETQNKNFSEVNLTEIVKKYIQAITSVSALLQARECSLFTTLNENQQKSLTLMDVDAQLLFYSINRVFSPNFQKDSFFLRDDLNSFRLDVDPILEKEAIYFSHDIHPIQTRGDYVANVISPLVWNSRQHAFNTENDIYHRTGKGFNKIIYLDGKVKDQIPQKNEYHLTVSDNGFGISDNILPYIFEKGFSTKKQDGIKHGVGLWGVREFVKKEGGNIVAESKIGQGTTFNITIPYSHKKAYLCIQ